MTPVSLCQVTSELLLNYRDIASGISQITFTCSGRKGRSEPEKEQKTSRERGYFEIATAATPFGDDLLMLYSRTTRATRVTDMERSREMISGQET